MQRRCRIEDDAGPGAALADQRQGAVQVFRGFGMHADQVGARIEKSPISRVCGLHHQVHVHETVDARLAQRLQHQGPDGQVGHVVIVHHVEVDDVGAGIEHGRYLFAEPGEIGGQDGRGDPGLHLQWVSRPRQSGIYRGGAALPNRRAPRSTAPACRCPSSSRPTPRRLPARGPRHRTWAHAGKTARRGARPAAPGRTGRGRSKRSRRRGRDAPSASRSRPTSGNRASASAACASASPPQRCGEPREREVGKNIAQQIRKGSFPSIGRAATMRPPVSSRVSSGLKCTSRPKLPPSPT